MKWINVKDRLPTDCQAVLIWPEPDVDEARYAFTGEYHSSKFERGNTEHKAGWYVETSDGCSSCLKPIHVTHWMPSIDLNSILFGTPTTGENNENNL
jgi:hypothetical protein